MPLTTPYGGERVRVFRNFLCALAAASMARHARVHAVERRVSTAEDLRRGRHRRRVGGKPEEEGRVGEVRPAVEAQRFGELEHDHLAEPFRRFQADGADAAGGDHEYV